MMGFATIDVDDEGSTTVWLTNREGRTEVSHGNAVTFRRGKDDNFDLIEQMVADRLMIFSPRTRLKDVPFDCLGVEPVDLKALIAETLKAQDVLQAAFEERRAVKGKESLVEPTRLRVVEDIPADWSSAVAPTLVIADHVASVWRAWLHTENERLKRVHWMPAGYDSPELLEFPNEFGMNVEVLPVRAYR